MSQSGAFCLALFTALCFGSAPLMGKVGLQRTDPLTGLALRSFAVSGGVLLTLLVTRHVQGFRELTPRTVLFLTAEGLLAAFIGHFAYYSALKCGEASCVVPLVYAMVPAIAFLGGVLFLAERVTPYKVWGVIFILVGTVLIRLQR